MKLINYVFYRISDAYINKWNDKRGHINGAGIITFIEVLNISSLLIIKEIVSPQFYQLYMKPLKGLNYLHSWTTIPALLLVAFNLRLFNKKKYNSLVEVWANEDKNLRKKRGWLIVGYIVLSVFLMVFLSIYLEHHHL
jgi:hypothetical protein